MGLIRDNVIPGKHGKVFRVDIGTKKEFKKARKELKQLKGFLKAKFNKKVFPHEMTIYTSLFVKVKDIQRTIQHVGFHAMPKTLLGL